MAAILISKSISSEEILIDSISGPQLGQSKRHEHDCLIGDSLEIAEIRKMIDRVAPENDSILIVGESGTGKELVARLIYRNSGRREKAFLSVNCETMPDPHLDLELFGQENEAHTGINGRNPGIIEQGDGGTVFLDEIADMPMTTQGKILRILQEQTFEPLGANRTIKTDVRIIAATNKSLVTAIKENRFRVDLFYRLKMASIYLPPLRERKSDIPLLANHFLKYYSGECGRRFDGIDPDAMGQLMAYPWPGNVRELENVIDHAIIIAKQDKILTKDLPQFLLQKPLPTQELTTLQDYEKNLILKTLKETNWNKHKASKRLNINRSTLYGKMKRYGLEKEQN